MGARAVALCVELLAGEATERCDLITGLGTIGPGVCRGNGLSLPSNDSVYSVFCFVTLGALVAPCRVPVNQS
jgi:hypothetical protein